jgi:hypothetical protein
MNNSAMQSDAASAFNVSFVTREGDVASKCALAGYLHRRNWNAEIAEHLM